jgi:hypothetical protein
LLRGIGLGLVALGAALCALVINNWEAILQVTKRSTAAAAGGLASAGLIALLGAALIIASRPQKMPVAAPLAS